jgi:hypothetical protein
MSGKSIECWTKFVTKNTFKARKVFQVLGLYVADHIESVDRLVTTQRLLTDKPVLDWLSGEQTFSGRVPI